MDFRIVLVMAFLDKLVYSDDFLVNFQSTKLDVSLLTKLKATLLKVLIVFNNDAAAADVKDVLGYAVFEVHNLFDEINTRALHCKAGIATSLHGMNNLYSPFNHFNRRLERLIERLEGLSLGEQLGELGVFKCDWNETPPTNSVLVDESSLQLVSLSTSVSVLLDKIVSGEFRSTKIDVSLLEKLSTTLLRVILDAGDVKMTLDLHDAGEILLVLITTMFFYSLRETYL